MATLIPSRSTCLRRMTGGEKRFSARLEQKLEDDYLIWYDVPIGLKQRRPDFVILHPRRGLLVLEVKDWHRETIQSADRSQFTLMTDRGLVREANPLLQARAGSLEIGVVLERDPSLVQRRSGPHAGKLAFPWAFGVVFTNIRRAQFEQGLLNEVIPSHLVICQDEMFETVDTEEFQARLWAMFPYVFPTTLSLPQIDRIRWHLFPEIRVEPGNGQFGLFDNGAVATPARIVPDVVRVMDKQQELLARSLGSEHRVIHGVAGSGKTMILGFRALHLAEAMTRPILVLCYNRSLAAWLERMMVSHGIGDSVQVYNFHRWCHRMLTQYHVELPTAGDPAFFAEMVRRVMDGVTRGQIPRFQYGAVLIDEGHDFEPDWYRLIVQMVDPSTNSLLVLYDDAQNIYGHSDRRRTSWKSLGIQAQGRTTILRLNYRNTLEILSVARHFARDALAERRADDDGVPLISPESVGRRGPVPELVRSGSERAEVQNLLEALDDEHRRGRPWREMAIVYRERWEGPKFARALGDAGIACVESPSDRGASIPADDAVRLMTMHSSKGLEFPWVAIPDLGRMPYRGSDELREVRLLYVAMTRATERLMLFQHADSTFTRRIAESVRIVAQRLGADTDTRGAAGYASSTESMA